MIYQSQKLILITLNNLIVVMITYIFFTNNYSKSLPIIFGHLSGFLVNESTNARDVLPSVVISFLSLKISYLNSIVEVGFLK